MKNSTNKPRFPNEFSWGGGKKKGSVGAGGRTRDKGASKKERGKWGESDWGLWQWGGWAKVGKGGDPVTVIKNAKTS